MTGQAMPNLQLVEPPNFFKTAIGLPVNGSLDMMETTHLFTFASTYLLTNGLGPSLAPRCRFPSIVMLKELSHGFRDHAPYYVIIILNASG